MEQMRLRNITTLPVRLCKPVYLESIQLYSVLYSSCSFGRVRGMDVGGDGRRLAMTDDAAEDPLCALTPRGVYVLGLQRTGSGSQ